MMLSCFRLHFRAVCSKNTTGVAGAQSCQYVAPILKNKQSINDFVPRVHVAASDNPSLYVDSNFRCVCGTKTRARREDKGETLILPTQKQCDGRNNNPLRYTARTGAGQMPQVMTATGPASPHYVEDAVDIIRKVHRTQGPGHVLAFFTGQDEIERAGRLLSEAVAQEKVDRRAMGIEAAGEGDGEGEADNGVSELVVVPLFGALAAEAQADAFRPARAGVRKVRLVAACDPENQRLNA